MKNRKMFLLVISLILFFFDSCVTFEDKFIPMNEKSQVIGTVKTDFVSFQFLHIPNKSGIREKAYSKLLEDAKKRYGNNVDVKNIKISGSFSGFEILNIAAGIGIGIPLAFGIGDGFLYPTYGNDANREAIVNIAALTGITIGIGLSGNTQKITATGDVVSIPRVGVEGALERAANDVSKDFNSNARIAIVQISAPDRSTRDYIIGELEYILQKQGYYMVDRAQLDKIFEEQRFGATSDVDDNTAARMGKISGASIVITGRVDGEGNLRRLRLRALNTETARVVGTASERL
jgi:hypothetical protein